MLRKDGSKLERCLAGTDAAELAAIRTRDHKPSFTKAVRVLGSEAMHHAKLMYLAQQKKEAGRGSRRPP